MPLDKFVLILVVVIGTAGLTVWLGTWIAAALQFPIGWVVAIPAALVAYVAYRVIIDRVSNSEDDYYDRIEK